MPSKYLFISAVAALLSIGTAMADLVVEPEPKTGFARLIAIDMGNSTSVTVAIVLAILIACGGACGIYRIRRSRD